MSHKTHHTYNTVRMFSLWFLPGYSPTVQRHAVSRVRLIDDSKLVQRCECECEWSVSVLALRQTLYLASCPMVAGIGSNLPTTLIWISGRAWMDEWMKSPSYFI